MVYTRQELKAVYARTSGHCHICGQKVSLTNYATPGRKGAWEVEHSRPRAAGGSDRLNNLYAACIGCNRDKGTVTTRTARAWNGRKRAPLSRTRRAEAKKENAVLGGVVGGPLGALAGPWGAAAGAAAGAYVGSQVEPDDA
jgi:5-methylcytosine-specific restriction endonuclease McrA